MSQARKYRRVLKWENRRLKIAREHPPPGTKTLFKGQVRAASRWAAKWQAREAREGRQ